MITKSIPSNCSEFIKPKILSIAVLLLLISGYCYAVTFNYIEVVSRNSEAGWELDTDLGLDGGQSPSVFYSANGSDPYPLPLTILWGGAYTVYYDVITGTVGGIPSDYNGAVFIWTVQDSENNLTATGTVSGIRQVPISKILSLSGSPRNPTITWSNSDIALDNFRIRLFDESMNLLGQWEVDKDNTSFEFAENKYTFEIGQTYIIRLEARDDEQFSLNGDLTQGLLLNRSHVEIHFTPNSKPLSGMLLLLSDH